MEQAQHGLVTTSTFGESTYGPRLDYQKAPKYRDPVFAVLYILHVIVVLAAGAYIWIKVYPDIHDDSNGSSLQYDFNIGGIVAAVFGCMVVGVLFGVCWLQIMKRFADIIIKGMLFFNIGVWIVVALLGLTFEGGIGLTIIGVIMALFYCLYTWCIWRRIPFANVLLSISSTIISRYQGTIFISLAVVVFNLLWIIIWFSCLVAYLVTATKEETVTDPDTGYTYTETKQPNNFVIFLLLISFYWGLQVNQNCSHMTTCGVAATWYFSTVIDHKPTPAAFKRTMTTSFGSVCLGSLIVAFLQAVRAMLRGSKNSRSCLTLLALCLLGCIERLIRYFNKYAYAQCAIYGTSFIQSAKATWNLFMTRGILAIINDDLTGMAILCGALIGGIVSAGAGWGIGYVFYNDDGDNYPTVPILLAVFGFFIGMVFCLLVLRVIASCVIALFVCYAEDPAAMYQNRPEEYNRLTQAKPTWGDVYTTYGGNKVQANYGPTVAVQPAQPVIYAQAPPQGQQQQVVYVQPQQQGQYVQPQQQVIYAQPPQQQQVVYSPNQPSQDGAQAYTKM